MNKLKDLKLKNQLIISTYIMLFILLIFKPTLIPSIYNRLIIVFKPFIIGGLIAFLINIPMKLIEEKIIKPLTKNHEKLNKLSRIIALVSTIIIVVIIVAAFINFIVPQLIESIKSLTETIPNYIISLQNYVTKNLSNLDILKNVEFDISSKLSLNSKNTLVSLNFSLSLIFNL